MATERTGTFGKYYGSAYTQSEDLSATEMETNAKYIYSYFMNKGWTLNAIAGMLGNMQAESGFNPGIWQSHAIGNLDGGYGLVQWTPATKHFEWCTEQSFIDPSTMDVNLAHIQYEVENGLQWIPTTDYPLTFQQFTKSTESVSYLAKAFLLNYERPKDQSTTVQEYRSTLALRWNEYLGGTTPNIPGGSQPKQKKRKGYNFVLFNRRRRINQ